MLVTLTDDEVRKALLDAAVSKTEQVLGMGDIDNTYFTVSVGNKEIEDIEDVQFTVNFE